MLTGSRFPESTTSSMARARRTMRGRIALLTGVVGVLVLIWGALLSAPFEASVSERVNELLAPSVAVVVVTLLSSLALRRVEKNLNHGTGVRWLVASWFAFFVGLGLRFHWEVALVAENLVVAAVLAAPATALAALALVVFTRIESSR